jgi:hypothetical protein
MLHHSFKLWQILLLTVTLASIAAPAVHAQVDTQAAREARAAIRSVRDRYRDSAEWNEWAQKLNLPDVQFELLAGDRGEPEVLQTAVLELLAGRVPQFAEGPFARLAKALDVRAQELTPLPADEWVAACNAALESYRPVLPERVDAGRAACQKRLDAFAQFFPPINVSGSQWNAYLFWDETRAVVEAKPGPAPDLAVLDRLETRWASAPTVWDDESLYETALSVRIYLRLLRGKIVAESAEQHAVAWNELATLLAEYSNGNPDTVKIAAAVNAREQRGEASRLTMSIRHALSQPNMVVKIDTKWLESQLQQDIDEPFDVNGVFAGTRSVGQGRLVGRMSGEVLPSSAVGRWLLRFNGTSTARATGSQDRVRVVSRATTKVAGTKPFRIDARGLTPDRASAGAISTIVYERIDADGLPRRRSQVVSETNAMRPQAERESAAYARQSILDRINQDAAKVAEDFNRSYHAELRDPRINLLRPSPEIRVRAADGAMRWECLLEGPKTFGAPEPPPEITEESEVSMSLAASALEEQAIINLGGRDLTGQQLLERMNGMTGESNLRYADAFNVSFAADPVDVRFEAGQVQVRLFVTKFDSDDVQYPAMTVDVAYQPEMRDAKVVFVRQGRVRVKSLANADGVAPKVSGRQQTLRLAVERKLAKVLTAELAAAEVKLPLAGDTETKLGVKAAKVSGTWLQLALTPLASP